MSFESNFSEFVFAASRYFGLVALVTIGASAPAFSHGAELGAISVGHFWSPEAETPADITPVFGPVFNGGDDAVTLKDVSSPIATRAGICKVKDGKAEWLESDQIAPSKALILADWREHICLEGVGRALKHGDTFPLLLDFGSAGTVSIDVYVGVEGD
jgi:copper(I)-binding protein